MQKPQFLRKLGISNLTQLQKALALLIYSYRNTDTPSLHFLQLVKDMETAGITGVNRSRLKSQLRRSNFTRRGTQRDTFALNLTHLDALQKELAALFKPVEKQATDAFVSSDLVHDTRRYLEKIVNQINGNFECGYFDGCAVLCRRLMESLLIEVYILQGRQSEIKKGAEFFQLGELIAYALSDTRLSLSRSAPSTMRKIKEIGDTAAHDRAYLTTRENLQDLQFRYGKLISELLTLSGIRK